jgi:Domain of unknown function (DUF222)
VSVAGLVQGIAAVDLSAADEAGVTAVLTQVRQVRGWLDSVGVVAARRLAELATLSPSMFPEHIAAEAGRVTLPEASKSFDRALTTAAIPEMGAVLAEGQTSGGHIDIVTHALRQLAPGQQNQLAERGEVLAAAASIQPRDEFARTVRAEVRRIHTDDGIARLEQQRRNTSLRTWTDKDTGMWCLRGEFDPETGALLEGRLRNTLLNGERARTIIDCGLDIELPVQTLRRWACLADITPIIVGVDGVSLYLGRERRTANRAQRRALRAMYRCCSIPGCTVAFDHCEIHHVRWFRRGGMSDIDNFVPLCHKHHHLVHEGGWNLLLDLRRNLTITYPDGSIMTTGPPSRWSR